MGGLTHVPRVTADHGGGMTNCIETVALRDGRRLSFDQQGPHDGPAVLYFHGAGASALARPPGDIATAAGVRLVSVERPGIGESDPLPHRSIVDWPADVGAVADALGLETFAVLGWSAGGPYALACAALLPDRVAACGVLFGAVPLDWDGWSEGVEPDLVPYYELAARSPDALRDALAQLAVDPEAFIRMFLERDPSAAPLLEDNDVVAQVLADCRRAFRQGADAMALDTTLIYSPWDFDVSSIGVPVRLVYGVEDRTCPPSWGRRLAARIPTATLTVLDDVGHNHGYDRGVFVGALQAVTAAAAAV